MIKFAELALLGCVAMRFLTGQWPWEWWQKRDTRTAERQARLLLGVPADAGREAIIDAHRRLIAQVHPDRGGSNAAVHEANDARDVLLEALGSRNRG